MIQMYHVNLHYGSDKPVLNDITLRIAKAEFVFVTGPSGAGKTSLLRLLFLAERCQSGQILLFGQNVARIKDQEKPALRRRIGVVFQDFKLLSSRTVRENLAIRLEVLGWPRRRIQRKVADQLELVGLAHKAHEFPVKLSGGEQQRVAIARALVNDPPILLADEPTGNLDAELSAQIYELLATINARGTTVLVATHDRAWVEHTNKRTIQLERGRVTSGGMPDSYS
jgi:cell division transport system ATP-binding protein